MSSEEGCCYDPGQEDHHPDDSWRQDAGSRILVRIVLPDRHHVPYGPGAAAGAAEQGDGDAVDVGDPLDHQGSEFLDVVVESVPGLDLLDKEDAGLEYDGEDHGGWDKHS